MSEREFTAPSLEEMDALLSAYEFEGQLSANETGAVYYARQKSLERHVALKLFSRAKGSDERFLASLKRSSSKVAGLKHPNLIGFIDSGLIDGMPFLVMEFVPGKSLHRSTHGHAIDFKQAMLILEEVCKGMAHAHEHQVVHGNLMPLNILLTQKASPKIGNFALGRGIHTLPDVKVPSHFSAPEVLEGETHTIASDVYSLGAILYELITATPWRVGAPPASQLEGSPAAVDKVIEKACHIDPAERYSGADEFYQALKKASSNKLKQAPVQASPPPARSRAMEMAMSTSGTGLWLKIVVIIVLLFAIKQVWNYRKNVKEQRELIAKGGGNSDSGQTSGESYEMTKRQGQARQQAATQQVEQPDPDPNPFPDDPETPMESLERLKGALVAGTFSELPIGAVSKGGAHLFLVEQPMSWDEAVAHAHQHGGSIALPDGDLSWSAQEPFAGRALWLGAARSGKDSFTTLEAKSWKPSAPLGGSASHVHLGDGGRLSTAAAATLMPYVIQWTEGAKPMSREELLAACASAIRSGEPIYPPGTIASGERHYLALTRSSSWEEASKSAQSLGGHLMAISGEKEAFEMENWRKQLTGSSSYWLGGQLQGDRWQWASGEPWRAVDWVEVSNAAQEGAAMIMRPASGIDAMGASASADGFIIEWSQDPQNNKPGQGAELPPLASPTELTETAKQLVIKAIADKETAHTKNTDKLAWDLDAHLRGLKKSDVDLWKPEIDKLKECVLNNRILKETIDDSGAKLSPFMAKLCNYLIRKQGEIDEQHVKSLQNIHAYYLKKLGEVRDQAKVRGQVRAQLAADELIKGSQNLDAWVARMSVGAP